MTEEATERALRAVRTGYHGEYSTFSTPEQLFEVFPPRRWVLIEKLQQLGPSSLRGLARALGRDVKRVHEDVAVMLEEGVVERDEQKKLFVPFARIRIELDLLGKKAA